MQTRAAVPGPSRPDPHRDVWRTGRALYVAQAVAGALGVAAWLLAARTHPAAEVGLAVALVGALSWAGVAGNLGLGTLLVGDLPLTLRRDQPRLAAVAAAIAALAGASIALAAALALQAFGGSLGAAASQPVVVASLVAGGGAWAAGVVVDHVAVAQAVPQLAVVRSSVSGVSRLGLLGLALAVAPRSAAALVAGWSVACLAGTAVVVALLVRRDQLRWRAPLAQVHGPTLVRRALRTHYGINLAGQAPPLLVPVALALVSTAPQVAGFAAAWQLAAAVGLVSPAVATGLFAAGSATSDARAVGHLARRTRRLTLAAVGLGSSALIVAGPWLLAKVGPAYAAIGSAALAILAVALVVDAITNVEVANLRLAERYGRAAAVNATIAVVAVGGTLAGGARWGATAAASAWLVGQAAGVGAAAIAARRAHRRHGAPTLHIVTAPSDTDRGAPPTTAAAPRPSITPSRSTHEDLARVRLPPSGPDQRRGPGDRAAERRPARHRVGGRGLGGHRRPASPGAGRFGPWAAPRGGRPGGGSAA